jgi:starch synthase
MIKCCHEFTAVSQGYMDELYNEAQGLEELIRQEHRKAHGIINGIDVEVWNPATDKMLDFNFSVKDATEGKRKNKEKLCEQYHLNPDLPLFSFIGRFASEKGADMLPDIIRRSIQETEGELNFMVLGSGNLHLEYVLKELQKEFNVNFALDLGYKEHLSHQIYASSDFLLMPSRVEPCGLNQMYAMRYGTIPIVRYTGGLKDTVVDIASGGNGLNYTFAGSDDAVHAIKRALYVYMDEELMKNLRNSTMNLDFSWEKSAEKYITLYNKN